MISFLDSAHSTEAASPSALHWTGLDMVVGLDFAMEMVAVLHRRPARLACLNLVGPE